MLLLNAILSFHLFKDAKICARHSVQNVTMVKTHDADAQGIYNFWRKKLRKYANKYRRKFLEVINMFITLILVMV